MLAQRLLVARILWGAILAGTVMFLGVGLYAPSVMAVGATADPVVFAVLSLLAVTTGAMSLLLPPFLTKTVLARLSPPVRDLPASEAMLRDRGRRKRVFVDGRDAFAKAMPALQTGMIVGLALAEAVAIFGLVLLILGYSFAQTIGFFAVSWVLIAREWPSEARFARRLETACDADLS